MGCGGSKPKGGQNSSTVPQKKNKYEYEQTGGHAGAIEFRDDKVYKRTRQSEVDNYKAIHQEKQDGEEETTLMKLKQFVPDLISGEAIPNDPKDRWGLTMPNLHYGWEHGSSMDIKMGTCTETPWMIEATRQKKYR